MTDSLPRRVLAVLFAATTLIADAHPGHDPRQGLENLSFQTRLSLPEGLPGQFTVEIPFEGSQLTLDLTKHQVFGHNTRFLVDHGDGELVAIEPGRDRSYLGRVAGRPDLAVSAVLGEDGLLATILRPGQESITIEPVAGKEGVHQVAITISGDHLPPAPQTFAGLLAEQTAPFPTAASTGPVTTVFTAIGANATTAPKSSATLRPERVMDVLEYEIGVEIGSRSFLEKGSYGSDMEKAKATVQGLVGNLDTRFLHSAGIKHRLGTVIIRTDPKDDPLRDKVTNYSAGSLAAFRDFWNKNPDKVGKTHDLAVYHVHYPPSGIAYVNTVGTGNRYALACGRSHWSWAGGTIAHEFGHSWNLHHNNKSGFFYEARPRNDKGTASAGGRNHHVSIMHGGGNHNIGRLSTEEADRVYSVRQNKRQFGDLIKDPGPIAPFGRYDRSFSEDGKPVTIDVIANDYDCNNDVLDLQLLDSMSFHGGSIELSPASGPGGRNELSYTPPSGFVGTDFFHYTVFDTTGRKDWGAVYVKVDGPAVVDTSRTRFNYDLGPVNSPIENGWEAITPKTRGDIRWKTGGFKELGATDRGTSSGVNNINRDFISSEGQATLSHKVSNGVWAVTLNLGDRTKERDGMKVMAEGKVIGSDVDAAAGKFPYVNAEVTVTDGMLDLTFSDWGGKDSEWTITRLSLERIGGLPVKVDPAKSAYHYDFGPAGSPVKEGWTALSPGVSGDIRWSGDKVEARDRNPDGAVSPLFRDLVQADGATTLHHRISNGVWKVTLNMSDPEFPHDLMGLRAEGQLISDAITVPAGHYGFVDAKGASSTEVSFEVEVNDGELTLEFFDNGGEDANWVVSRLSLEKR
ncbi:MAG: Ig-like domain-containing protein [Verrucomicrobiota bacterium]